MPRPVDFVPYIEIPLNRTACSKLLIGKLVPLSLLCDCLVWMVEREMIFMNPKKYLLPYSMTV